MSKEDLIKLDKVYTDGEKFYRGVGWFGESVMCEEVAIQSHFVDGFIGVKTKVVRSNGRKLKRFSLNEFHDKMREPTAEEVELEMNRWL